MKRTAIVLVSLGAVVVLLCAYLCWSLAGAKTTWKTTSVVDEEFLVLLFPVAGNTSCQRAVLANLAEYNRESIEVYADGVAVTVPRKDFTPVPPPDCNAYVECLNRELGLWGAETDWSHIQYAVTPSEEGDRAMVTVRDKSGTTRAYAYLIKGDAVQPLDVTTDVSIAKNMAQ